MFNPSTFSILCNVSRYVQVKASFSQGNILEREVKRTLKCLFYFKLFPSVKKPTRYYSLPCFIAPWVAKLKARSLESTMWWAPSCRRILNPAILFPVRSPVKQNKLKGLGSCDSTSNRFYLEILPVWKHSITWNPVWRSLTTDFKFLNPSQSLPGTPVAAVCRLQVYNQCKQTTAGILRLILFLWLYEVFNLLCLLFYKENQLSRIVTIAG